jgi:enoyl-CoA hydratase/carnithine racemase
MKLRITHHSAAYWRVTIDNPPINMMDPELIDELRQLIADMEASKELKVVVFDSADPEYFMAHYDLLRAGETSKELGTTGLSTLPDFLQRLLHLSVISIASIRGRARGVGAELVAGLDIRFGSRENMLLAQIEVGCGVVPGGGGSERLPLLVGRSRALEIIASADDYDADTAERYGWINRAIPDAELDDFVDQFARRIATFDKRALGAAKRNINRMTVLAEESRLTAAEVAFDRALAWPETQARVGHMLEKGFQQRGDYELRLGYHLGQE